MGMTKKKDRHPLLDKASHVLDIFQPILALVFVLWTALRIVVEHWEWQRAIAYMIVCALLVISVQLSSVIRLLKGDKK